MNNVISKKEFVSGYMPSGEWKEIQPPKIGLFPGDKCKINGNIYSISINENDMVELTFIERNEIEED